MAKKLKRWQRHEEIQRVLERYRRFDFDYIPFGTYWTMPDGSYRYQDKGLNKVAAFFVRLFMATLGVLLIKVWYGARVKGKENLKAVKGMGAFCATNHFSYMDILLTRYATGYFRSFVTVAPYNNKKGVGGWFMRRAGILPLSSSFSATRNLWKETGRLLEEKKLISFYAEKAMWCGYQKPRPMKDGVFFYAVKFNAPVLPVFCTFRKSKNGRLKGTTVHILPAIFPDDTLEKNARQADMLARAQAEWQACYEQFYGIPLEYEPSARGADQT